VPHSTFSKKFLYIPRLKAGGVSIQEILIFSSVVTAGISLLLFIISAVSYTRLKEIKLLFISIAFFIFFLKGIIALLLEIATSLILFDFLIILLLYLSIVKK